jgi:hypothetical protein
LLSIQTSTAQSIEIKFDKKTVQLSKFYDLIRNRKKPNDKIEIINDALKYHDFDTKKTTEFLKSIFIKTGNGQLNQSWKDIIQALSINGDPHSSEKDGAGDAISNFSLNSPRVSSPQEIDIQATSFLDHEWTKVDTFDEDRETPTATDTNPATPELKLYQKSAFLKVEGAFSSDERTRKLTIQSLRGADGGYKLHDGLLYAPYLLETASAITSLSESAVDCSTIFSIERGGSLISDHIKNKINLTNPHNAPNFIKISKWADAENRQREFSRETIKENVIQIISDHLKQLSNQAIKIGFCETMVSGDSANRALSMLIEVAKKFPTVTFKVLLLRQTLNHHKEQPNNLAIEIPTTHNGCMLSELKPSKQFENTTLELQQQFDIRLASVSMIPGEDVSYLNLYKGEKSEKPITVFAGRTPESLCVYTLTPPRNSPARTMLSQIIAAGNFYDKVPALHPDEIARNTIERSPDENQSTNYDLKSVTEHSYAGFSSIFSDYGDGNGDY